MAEIADSPAVEKAAIEPSRCDRVAWLFLRGLGLIYLAAFASFGVQAMGLIGSHGILPLTEFTANLRSYWGAGRYWQVPMVFWFEGSDAFILFVCWTGVALSVLLVLDILPRLCLLLLYVFYLSLMYAGQDFMTYQWDIFLVEAGFLALLMSFATMPGIWLLRWLQFRFMFLSGFVKLASGDPTWRHLSALSYHFLTQPLPTPLAWYAAQFSPEVLRYLTGATLFIEGVLPFLIFNVRRLRFIAAFGFLGLETCIFLTGNYNFFNLQTMLMCLPLFDDAALEKALPVRFSKLLDRRVKANAPGRPAFFAVAALSSLILFVSLVQLDMMFEGDTPPALVALERAVQPLRIVNTYGLFAVMTTKRREIVIEGSADGVEWKEYAFRYKPGDVRRPPLWNIPHQPRLDWQMWFAALESPAEIPWFSLFLKRLLENSPPVTTLLENNPFPDKPPRFIRARFYDYTFASPEEKEKGIWWNRRLLGLYFPEVSLISQ